MSIQWITPPTIEKPAEITKADLANMRRLRINRYRSRTEVTNEHINTAYLWFRLPNIVDNNLNTGRNNSHVLFRTVPVPRGIDPDEALTHSLEVLSEVQGSYNTLKILMYNTSTAAAATEKIRDWFEAQDAWIKLDAETLITTTATHKASIYKNTIEGENTYVILNNLDTPNTVFKIATAIMLDMNFFEDDTRTFAEAWLNGNGDEVYTAVNNYYKEYKENKAARQREEALEALSQAMVVDRTNDFNRRMNSINSEIKRLFDEIAEYTQRLNQIKGEYLLYNLENEEDKSKQLRDFFKACGDKISYIHYSPDGMLYIVYKTSLMYYEPNLLRRYFDSTRDNCVNSAIPYKKQLLKDIFLDNTYELLIESGVSLSINNARVNYVEPMNVIGSSATELYGIPNPHHRYYNCWGDNGPNITQALIDKDYITAITTSFAAMAGLNISDTAVLTKFISEEIPGYNTVPCLKNKATGEIISIAQYERRFEDNASDETN